MNYIYQEHPLCERSAADVAKLWWQIINPAPSIIALFTNFTLWIVAGFYSRISEQSSTHFWIKADNGETARLRIKVSFREVQLTK